MVSVLRRQPQRQATVISSAAYEPRCNMVGLCDGSIQGLSLNYLDPRVVQAVYNHNKTQYGGMRGTQEQYV